eukprot:scaffold11.g3893.t1
MLHSNQSADASAPESHRQLVVRQLYEQPKRFSDVSYLELLEDEGLAPLTKAAQRWIYEAQHPDPATCTQQQFVVAGEECLPDGNGLGSCIHIAGEHLSAALQHGAAVVWAKDAGVQFVDRGCGAGEPHANMLCLFEPPSSCGLEHVTPGNNLGFRYFKEGGPAFKDRGLKFEPHAPPRLVAKLRERLVPMGIDAMPDFLKYWWRVQSAAYLARPNARLRGELARLRRRRDMFLRLTPQRKVSPPSYPLPPGTVHVRVRHAAAKGAEMLLLPLGKYLEAAEHRVVNTNPLAFKKYGILSTDDTDIVKEAAKVEKLTGHPETSPDGSWVLFASNDNRTDKGGVDWSEELKALGAQRQISSHLLNLFVALECDAWGGIAQLAASNGPKGTVGKVAVFVSSSTARHEQSKGEEDEAAKQQLSGEPDPSECSLCGHWQENYARLHADIRAGRRPPRYLVAVGVHSGLADNLVGMMSEFYFALLSHRAFLLTSWGPHPHMDWAFDAPRINWTTAAYGEDDPLILPLRREMPVPRYDSARINTSMYYPMYVQQDHWWLGRNLTAEPAGAAHVPYILMASNRGKTYRLFENPHHAPALRAMGLRPEHAFYCAFHFLFAPSAPTRELMAATQAALTGDPSALKIGIQARACALRGACASAASSQQPCVLALHCWPRPRPMFGVCCLPMQIRFNDTVLTKDMPGPALLHQKLHMFACAQEIENDRRTPGQKVLTDDRMRPAHLDCEINGQKCDAESVKYVLRSAVAEMLLFSLTDYQVITFGSGFGRAGAFLSPHWRRIYTVEHAPRTCGRFEYDSLETVATDYAGIRRRRRRRRKKRR